MKFLKHTLSGLKHKLQSSKFQSSKSYSVSKNFLIVSLVVHLVFALVFVVVFVKYLGYKNESTSAKQYIAASALLKRSDASALDENALAAIRKLSNKEYRARLILEASSVFARSNQNEKALMLMDEASNVYSKSAFVDGVSIKKIEIMIRSKDQQLAKRYNLDGLVKQISFSDSPYRFYVRELNALYRFQQKDFAGFDSELQKIIKDQNASAEVRERAQKLLDAKPQLIKAQAEFEQKSKAAAKK